MHPRLLFAIEMALPPSRGNFLSREEKTGWRPGVGGTDRRWCHRLHCLSGNSSIKPSPLILCRVTKERGGLPQFGHFGVSVCSRAGGVKSIRFVSKAQMSCCQAEPQAQQHLLRNKGSNANSPQCKTELCHLLVSSLIYSFWVLNDIIERWVFFLKPCRERGAFQMDESMSEIYVRCLSQVRRGFGFIRYEYCCEIQGWTLSSGKRR